MSRLLNRPRQLIVISILIISIIGAYGLLRQSDQPDGLQGEASATPGQSLAAFSENGVAVDITLEKDTSGQAWLVGTFTPLQKHFHLYSKDLPKGGINAQGRPTLLEIVSPGLVKPIGSLIANQPTIDHYTQALKGTLPVYPEGPVTLRQRVELPQNSASEPTELSITYMACSENICLSPVMDKKVSVVIAEATER